MVGEGPGWFRDPGAKKDGVFWKRERSPESGTAEEPSLVRVPTNGGHFRPQELSIDVKFLSYSTG